MCCFNNGGRIDVSDKVVENTVELAAYICKKYDIYYIIQYYFNIRDGTAMKVTLQNLTKKFPSRSKKNPADVIAVNDFTFEIPDGKLIGLLGPSGCGKTTILRILIGLLDATSGTVIKDGRDITKATPQEMRSLVCAQCHVEYYFKGDGKVVTFPWDKGMTMEEKNVANTKMNEAFSKLNVVAENYPDLKANTNFMDLQGQLKAVEEDIANSRKYYNAVIKQFNTKCEMFPSNIIASIFKFEKKPMFEVDAPEERQNVKVSFSQFILNINPF